MANPQWSAMTDPPELLLAGNSRKWASDILVSDMDAGPPRKRRKSSAAAEPIAGAVRVNLAQRNELRTFYYTSCKGGTLVFDWVDPVTGVTVEFGFADEPDEKREGPNLFYIALPLEIMP